MAPYATRFLPLRSDPRRSGADRDAARHIFINRKNLTCFIKADEAAAVTRHYRRQGASCAYSPTKGDYYVKLDRLCREQQ